MLFVAITFNNNVEVTFHSLPSDFESKVSTHAIYKVRNVWQLFLTACTCPLLCFANSVFCSPVNVLLESNGKTLKVGEVLLGDLQVLYELI